MPLPSRALGRKLHSFGSSSNFLSSITTSVEADSRSVNNSPMLGRMMTTDASSGKSDVDLFLGPAISQLRSDAQPVGGVLADLDLSRGLF